MEVRRFEDPEAYAELALPFLMRASGRHNLFLGILDLLQRRPEVYESFHLWAVEAHRNVVGAALQTPPHNVVIAEPTDPSAITALVDVVATTPGGRPPGVVGGLPEAKDFATSWVARSGGQVEVSTRQGIYELTSVRSRGAAKGAPRQAVRGDLELLAAWHEAFIAEAAPQFIGDPGSRRRRMEAAIDDGGYWLWEDGGRAVSMTGVSPAPPRGARVGPVYTPPEDRRRGYATALVAYASARELAGGRSACYLHTDLANPTSNDIYVQIGYDWVCEAVDLRFVDQSQSGGVGV
jgi:GNAT superfamily N-acetyltransferase